MCDNCNTSNAWFRNVDGCQHAKKSPEIPLGFGPNLATGSIEACKESNCKICTANYQTCTECGPRYSTSSGLCVRCDDINCLTCSESAHVCTKCDASSYFELKGTKCEGKSSSIKDDERVEKASSAMSNILGVAAFIGRLVVAPFSYGAAFITQSLTSQLLILATLDGPEVKRSESVLRSVTHLARWFPTGNPFGTWGDRASCQLSPAMERNQFTCSLIENMGAHFVMLLVIGFVCTLITVAAMVVMVKASPSSTKTRAVMDWLRNNFGISFVLSLGNAMHFELLFYSLHSFAKSSNTSLMIFSDLIGATVIACLALSMATQIYLAVWIWKQVKLTSGVAMAQPEEQRSEPSAKKSVQLLGDTIDLKSVPRGLGSFTCLFAEHRVPTRFFQLLIGSSLSVKNLIQSILILSTPDYPALQVSLVLIAELAYMGLYLISRPIASRLLFGVHMLNHCCMVIFMILKIATTSTQVSDYTREGPLGDAMAAFVYISILATSLYTLIACMQACSQLILWIKGRRISQVAPIESDISPSSQREKASLIENAKNVFPAILKASGDVFAKKILIKDLSNQQGLAGNPIGENELIPPTQKADTKPVIECAQAD